MIVARWQLALFLVAISACAGQAQHDPGPPVAHDSGLRADGALAFGDSDDAGPRRRDAKPDQKRADQHPLLAEVVLLAGDGTAGFADGAAAGARFKSPRGLALDGSGGLIVADRSNQRIRRIDLAGRQVSTLAGTGVDGFLDGPAASAQLQWPAGVAVSFGKIYIADSDNHRIRQLDPNSLQVTTVAGSGDPGFFDNYGVGAKFNQPTGVTVSGALLYVADSENQRLRLIKLYGQTEVKTSAGNGVAGFADGAALGAELSAPGGVAVDGAGRVFIADTANHRIRLFDPTTAAVSTVAGSGTAGFADGPALSSKLSSPTGVAVDGSGTVIIADSGNHRIRQLINGQLRTLAGDGTKGYAEGPLATARFSSPTGVAVEASGHFIYVADSGNHRLRLITLP
jgi:DNA-binding beta-propeller fold protein YncE